MIFVTVGTHEQQFDRLISYVDRLKEEGLINEEVIIQSGFSLYEPKYCIWSKLITYSEMLKYVANARIVITHGGPASFIMPLQIGKVPVVVPRQYKYNEHVNNHQVRFVQAVSEKQGNIIPVYKIEELERIICEYDQIVLSMPQRIQSNNHLFVKKFKACVDELFSN